MAKTKTKEEKQPEEALVGTKGSYSLTVYFFAVVNGRRFPAQQTLACDDADDFTRMLPEFYAAFDPSGDEDEFVTYEPRDIGPAPRAARPSGGGGAQTAPAQQERVLGPPCPFHDTPTTEKQGRNGPFFSCSKKRDDGSWCNWTPPQEN